MFCKSALLWEECSRLGYLTGTVIEQNSTAILYTGDLRSEPWFVNSIARHPVLVEYTTGIRTLDKIYLDTSFTEDVPFQTKREGIAELLRKVAKYPSDTIFYFQTWTYGYEDVWVALSKALKSQVRRSSVPRTLTRSLIHGRFMSTNTKWAFIPPYHPNLVTPVLQRILILTRLPQR